MGALMQGVSPSGWQLKPEGLEHEPTGYFIERGALAARRADGHWEWPLHMAEKTWCAPRGFRDAFVAALSAFGVEPDARLAESFALARDGREGRVAQAPQDRFVLLAESCPGLRPLRAAGRRQGERARPVPATETVRPLAAQASA